MHARSWARRPQPLVRMRQRRASMQASIDRPAERNGSRRASLHLDLHALRPSPLTLMAGRSSWIAAGLSFRVPKTPPITAERRRWPLGGRVARLGGECLREEERPALGSGSLILSHSECVSKRRERTSVNRVAGNSAARSSETNTQQIHRESIPSYKLIDQASGASVLRAHGTSQSSFGGELRGRSRGLAARSSSFDGFAVVMNV